MIANLARYRQPITPPVDRLNASSAMVAASVSAKVVEGPVPSARAVSASAFAAADLFSAASSFVQAEHLKPFSGYDHGIVHESGYLNVERYNNYLFDKAATTMVSEGQKAGLSLNKDDILTALRSANSGIAALKDDNEARVKLLGPGSVLIDLSTSEMRNFTDMYIAAKEKGLDTNRVKEAATLQGMANKDKRLGITTVVYDPEKEKTGYGNTLASEKVSSTSEKPWDKLKTSLYDSFGLSNAMINLLVDSVKAGSTDGKKILDFIQALFS